MTDDVSAGDGTICAVIGSTDDVSTVTIVVLSRLMYRKGVDLLIPLIPRICQLHPDVRFLIGGDGPKRVELEQMCERYFLQDRVELVGAVPQSEVRQVSLDSSETS